MIDKQAVALVTAVQAKLAKMKDARPSEVLRVKEQFGEQFLAVLTAADTTIADAEKIALFDKLRADEIERLTEQVQNAISGQGFYDDDRDSDHTEFVHEAVLQGTLGKDIFTAINALDKLLS